MSKSDNFSEQSILDETDNINAVRFTMECCMLDASLKSFH